MLDGPAEFRYFRKDDDGSATTGHVYPAGLQQATPTNTIVGTGGIEFLQPGTGASGIDNTNSLYAIPEVFPRNFEIRRLVQTHLGATTQHANNLMRLGIYNDSGAGNPYPKDLLFDSGNIGIGLPTQAGVILLQAPCVVGVPGGSLLWFVAIFHEETINNGCAIWKQPPAHMHPMLGTRCLDLTQGGGGGAAPQMFVGWRHARTFGALPARFPTSSPSRLVMTDNPGTPNIPCIFFGGRTIG